MDRKETIAIIATIKITYPASYKDTTEEERRLLYSLWQDQFQDIPYELVKKALFAYASENKFPPTIADIGEQIDYFKRKAYAALDSHKKQLKENAECMKYGQKPFNVGKILSDEQLAIINETLRVCENRQLRINEMAWESDKLKIGGKTE